MPAGGKAYPVRVIVEVDQRDRLCKVFQQSRCQMVVITGADEEYLWLVCRSFGAVLQGFDKALIVAFAGP